MDKPYLTSGSAGGPSPVVQPVRQCGGEGAADGGAVGGSPVDPAVDLHLVLVPFEPVDHLQVGELGVGLGAEHLLPPGALDVDFRGAAGRRVVEGGGFR